MPTKLKAAQKRKDVRVFLLGCIHPRPIRLTSKRKLVFAIVDTWVPAAVDFSNYTILDNFLKEPLLIIGAFIGLKLQFLLSGRKVRPDLQSIRGYLDKYNKMKPKTKTFDISINWMVSHFHHIYNYLI